MKTILQAIQEASEKIELMRSEETVIVMHPSTIEKVKDHVHTRRKFTHFGIENLMFINDIQIYLSFYLPINHFTPMKRKDYNEWIEKNNPTK